MSESNLAVDTKKKSKFKFPDATIILLALIIFTGILSWIIPAGSYERLTDEASGNVTVVPNSYQQIEATPLGPVSVALSIPNALVDVAGIFMYILIIGGGIGIVNATGSLNACIAAVLRKFRKQGPFLICLLSCIISFLAATMGFGAEGMALLPIFVSLFMALGYDSIVAVAVVTGSSATGCGAAISCPFNLGIAQGIAGLPMFSGISFRIIILVVMVAIQCFFIVRYAKKVQKTPSYSYLHGCDIDFSDTQISQEQIDNNNLTATNVLVVCIYLGAILLVIFGSLKHLLPTWGHYSALFMVSGIVAGIVGRLKPQEIVDAFAEGCRFQLYPALLLGLAAAIPALLQQAGIMDTLVYYLLKPLELFGESSKYIGGVAMMWIQIALNVIMPSNSGQALATMPIMLPLGDLLHINKQITVLAFQLGDGLTQNLFPTFGGVMAACAIARVPFPKWIKFSIQFVAAQAVAASIFMIIAVAINYGPF